MSGGATPASERGDRQKVGALGVVRDYMRDLRVNGDAPHAMSDSILQLGYH